MVGWSTLASGTFGYLRTEVWRLASRPERSERELIQDLLDLLGPSLLLTRAGFYEKAPPVDYVCRIEWKLPEVPSSLGRSVPTRVGALLVSRQAPAQLTGEQMRSRLAGIDDEDGGALPEAIAEFPTSSRFLLLPFNLAGSLEGVLVLARWATDETPPAAWSPDQQELAAELIQIISLVVERTRAEIALRASEQRYRSLVENLGDGVGIMGPDEMFLYANPAGHEVFGMPPGTLTGRSLREFTDERAYHKATEQTGLRKQGKRSVYELEIRRPDGTPRTIVVTAVPEHDENGHLRATIGAFRDVTEQRKAEEQRQAMEARVHQAQKLESLGLLAGGIAHDFNNLLLGVMANADLALHEAPEPGLLRECLDDILNASRKASELTSQMLAYSGRGRVQIQQLDFSAVVQDMALLLRASISKKAVMVFNLATGLPCIEGDASQIRQVVMNLITNASDALGDAPGRITMSTGTVEVDRATTADPLTTGNPKPGEHVYFEVEDSGCGMDDATRARIFDPFFTTRFTGRGLGLAAVLGIVRSHQGAIRVDSRPEKGSVFRVMFPSAGKAASQPADARRPEAEPWKGSGTVLVIDDEDVVRRATTRILERAGFKVLGARDGPDGLKLYEANAKEIGLVVLDLAMPQMGGEEVFRLLRNSDPGLPVVLISGYDEQEAAVRFAAKGVAAFVRKPFDSESLLGPIRKTLGG
jgi:PAS domain S-box-containing protein